MYEDGKKSFLSGIFYTVLWLGGLVLLIYVVYKVGFASMFGNAEDTISGGDENIIIADEDGAAPIINEEELEAESLAEQAEEAEAPPEESGESTEEEPAEPQPDENAARINEIIAGMSPEQKAAQLFFVTPEELTGVEKATVFGSMSVSSYAEHPVGGLIYFANNFESPDQTKEMLKKANDCSMETTGLPLFVGIDEEGGRILRLADNDAFGLEKTKSMAELAGEGVEDAVYHAADNIGSYLKEYGFNVDFAPVADVLTNPENTVISDRSFGTDPELVSKLCSDYASGLHNNGILSCYKHFPGHGGTKDDTHDDSASSERTIDELRTAELVPFANGITEGIDFIMSAHILLPNIPESEGLPASLSPYILTDLLRNELGYDGIVIPDALNMKAITNTYGSGEAAVKAFMAGCDMLLMPEDFESAYNTILEKINSGEIPEDRLNQSLYRIIRKKLNL